MRYLPALLTVPLLLIARWMAYRGLFRLRNLPVSLWTSLLIAGAPLALLAVPLPFPFPVTAVLGLASAVYLSMKYGSVPFFPEAVGLCLLVESGTWALAWLAFEGLIGS